MSAIKGEPKIPLSIWRQLIRGVRFSMTPDSCWGWVRTLRNGYGNIGDWKTKKNHYAHRLMWEITNGKIPRGLCVLHRCDNRKCVRPSHLFLGTKKDNTHDMIAKGRHRFYGLRRKLA